MYKQQSEQETLMSLNTENMLNPIKNIEIQNVKLRKK